MLSTETVSFAECFHSLTMRMDHTLAHTDPATGWQHLHDGSSELGTGAPSRARRSLAAMSSEFNAFNWNYNKQTRAANVTRYDISNTLVGSKLQGLGKLFLQDSFAYITATVSCELAVSRFSIDTFIFDVTLTAGLVLMPVMSINVVPTAPWKGKFDVFSTPQLPSVSWLRPLAS